MKPLIVGSCNGLVCFYVTHDFIKDPIYILNPASGEAVYLPPIYQGPNAPDVYLTDSVYGGFGYLPSTGQYKVVRLYGFTKVQVVTLGDQRGWRSKEDIDFKLNKSGINAHGSIFWIDYSRISVRRLVSFNLETEKFETHASAPISFRDNSDVYIELMQVGLTVGVYYSELMRELRIDILTPISRIRTRSHTAVTHFQWEVKFRIDLFQTAGNAVSSKGYCIPVAVGHNNDLLFWKSRNLYRYDTSTHKFLKVLEQYPLDVIVDIVPFMPSTVSLKGVVGWIGTWDKATSAANNFLRGYSVLDLCKGFLTE